MRRVPGAREVSQALRTTAKAVKVSLRDLNQQAAQLMARGDYSGAEAMAAKGRDIQAFQNEVENLRSRWNGIRGVAGEAGEKRATTALWSYYQPILQALLELNGEGTRGEIEPQVEKAMKGELQPGDYDPLGRGQLRWQIMIRRARRHLVNEGWLEPGSGQIWRITAAGRRAAKAKPERR